MPISVDFESFYSKKLKYSLTSMIPEQYCAHDLFDAYMVSVSDGTHSWAGSTKNFNWNALEGQVLLSHNRRFDHTVFNELIKRQWIPKVTPAQWHCTANLTSFVCNRRSLDQSVEFLYRIKLDKSARSDAAEKHWPNDFTPEQQETMLKYAKADAHWCWKLWNDFSPLWPDWERRLSTLTINQGMHGVKIDVDRLNEYILLTHDMLAKTVDLIPWMSDAEDEEWQEFDTKPTATKCIAEQCRRLGIQCPPVKSKDEEGYEEWEERFGPKHEWVYAVSAWRSVNKLYKSFLTVKERIRPDGTLPFSLKYFGAHTGRWSGDSRVNMQNMRKIPALKNERGLLEQNEGRIGEATDSFEENETWPEWVKGVIDFRGLVIPRTGKKMIVSDLSQIEPRCLAWITGDKKMMEYVAAGNSVYEAHARASMNYDGPKMVGKEKNSTIYKLAKARILGLGYGCGWEKFIKMAYTLARLNVTEGDPEWLDEEDPFTGEVTRVSGFGAGSKKIVNEFRSQNTGITDLWRKLDDSFKSSTGGDLTLTLPSGRKLTYRDVRCCIEFRKDPKTKKSKQQWAWTADIGGKRFKFYGGKLTENLIQAIARDVFAQHLLRMEDRGWTNLFSVHDEAILEVDSEVTKEDVEHEMSWCPDWIKGCPIAAEAKEVSRYLK